MQWKYLNIRYKIRTGYIYIYIYILHIYTYCTYYCIHVRMGVYSCKQHKGEDNAAHLDGDADFSSIHLFQATEAPKFYCFNMATAATTAAITQRGHHTTDLFQKSVPTNHKTWGLSTQFWPQCPWWVGVCVRVCVCDNFASLLCRFLPNVQ